MMKISLAIAIGQFMWGAVQPVVSAATATGRTLWK